MEQFENLVVFSEEKFSKISTEEKENFTISDNIHLSEDEKSILRIHSKFAMVEDLSVLKFEIEKELSFAKIRMEIRNEEQKEKQKRKEAPYLEVVIDSKIENDKQQKKTDRGRKLGPTLTTKEKNEIDDLMKKLEDEEMKREEEDSKLRQTFDPIKKIFDSRRRRVTDLDECARVTLPKPLKILDEASIEIRRSIQTKIFQDYLKEKTSNGEQISNLSPQEIRGLKSLLKRIRAGEILIMKTDKSGRLMVVSVEDYLAMGEVHTRNDKPITRKEIGEIEKQLNGHSASWAKIFSTGTNHGHLDSRARPIFFNRF